MSARRLGGAFAVVVLASACSGDDGAGVDVDAAAAADGAADASGGAMPPLDEDFGVGAGAAWPAGWRVLGDVASATVEDGRGRLVPVVSGYTLGRMGHALPAGAADVDVTFTLAMSEPDRQGVGLYVRQNGGYLRRGTPTGAGYAVFVEAFRGPRLGVWRERDGVEEELRTEPIAAIAAGAGYAVRFRCTQAAGATVLAAKLWPAGTAEPAAWTVMATDSTAALQGAAGGVAVDAWNTVTPGGPSPGPIFVDDLVVTSAP